MMRSAHRSSSSELPLTRNMPFPSNSVPSRNQPRNMTGIYLGLEGNIRPPGQKNYIPPLARGRGTSQRLRTPAENKRYKLVEKMRIKEEKRGFAGQPVKTTKRSSSAGGDATVERKKAVISPDYTETFPDRTSTSLKPKQWGPAKYADRTEFFDLIRTNPRNYTVVVNNGVTRSENLSGLMSFALNSDDRLAWPEILADEVHRISTNDIEEVAGLEECYKRVCKGNMESLQSLLPYRQKQQRENTQYSTGFSVKSYNNLNRGEIMADFSQTNNRPRTVPLNRPMVPSPYFFKYYNNPYNGKYPAVSSAKSTRKGMNQQIDNPFSVMNETRIVGLPGAGAVTRSIKSRASAWTESDIKLHAKLHGSPRESGDETGMKDVIVSGRQVQIPVTDPTIGPGPNTSRTEDTVDQAATVQLSTINGTATLDNPLQNNENTTDSVEKTAATMEVLQENIDKKKKDSFILGVADEHGKEGEVEIDTADLEEAPKGKC